MLETFFSTPSLHGFIEEVKKNSSIVVEHLWSSPQALLSVLAQQASKKPILLISAKKNDSLLDDLSFFCPQKVLDFLPWDILPGEDPSPSPDIVGHRLETLYELATKKRQETLIHCSIQSLMQKTVSPKTLTSLCQQFQVGQNYTFHNIAELLSRLGYQRVPLTSDKGEFSVRGGIIDLFPLSASQPYRLDFLGDYLEEIRAFDPISQKSTNRVESCFLCPTSEWTLVQQEKQSHTLFSYLPDNLFIVLLDPLAIEDAYIGSLPLFSHAQKILFSLDDILQHISKHPCIFFLDHSAEELSDVVYPKRLGRKFHSGESPFQPISFQIAHKPFQASRWNHPFIEVQDFFCSGENKEVATPEEILEGIQKYKKNPPLTFHCVVASTAEKDKLQPKLPLHTTFVQGLLSSGFVIEETHLVWLSATLFSHRQRIRRHKWRQTFHASSSDFHEFFPGDTVVHTQNGIGKFLGIDHKPNHLGIDTEYLKIGYAENSLLYVPVSQSHLVTRYIGAGEETPKLNTLNSSRWQKSCQKAQTAILGYAKQLLDQMAARAASPGFCFPCDSTEMQLFEEEFPFQETEDQLRAIASIKQDMCSGKAMDRLICGDVGYGKTEVAMRAAFKAVCDGKKQVIVLVPTTILAMQHCETFKARMANFPVEIEMLSRFVSPKKAKEITQRFASGQIDILIGTHRILNKELKYKDLGLLIIDEEQRFGVRAKEYIRNFKVGVDCLTLSATPIPRTLYMSLVGMREISEINTPPYDRLPIKSVVIERDSSVIKQALLREFGRQGQAFFIHNRVETLPVIFQELQSLIPESNIAMGHGQMDSEELDTVFQTFKQGAADLLLCTTIVENGVDIPNANTIFIDRADRFGMADLYQLRGRVGRWNKPAFAYFLTPKGQTLPEISRKRLQALVEHSGYGGGLKIALRDLEIRGAGNILGEEQSGQVSAIGFHYYCRLLKKAVEALRKEEPIQLLETRIECPYDAKIPAGYVEEASLRMEIYHRLGQAASFEEIREIQNELADRFGPLPPQVIWLTVFTRIKIFASGRQISLLKFDKLTWYIEKIAGERTYKETFALPSMKNPEIFEQMVLEKITNWRPFER